MEHAVSTAMASYKGLRSLVIALGGAYYIGRTRQPHNLSLLLVLVLLLLYTKISEAHIVTK